MANRYEHFSISGNYIVLHTKKVYTRTDSGKSWKNKPDSITRTVIDIEHYNNYVTSIPFFNRFGNGAYCRGTYEYTCAGYIPTSIVTVSPFKEIKHIDTFIFISLYDLTINAGFREKDVIENASTWNSEYVKGRGTIITLYKKDGYGATYQENGRIWVN